MKKINPYKAQAALVAVSADTKSPAPQAQYVYDHGVKVRAYYHEDGRIDEYRTFHRLID